MTKKEIGRVASRFVGEERTTSLKYPRRPTTVTVTDARQPSWEVGLYPHHPPIPSAPRSALDGRRITRHVSCFTLETVPRTLVLHRPRRAPVPGLVLRQHRHNLLFDQEAQRNRSPRVA